MRLPRRRFLAGSLAAGAIACPIGIVRANRPPSRPIPSRSASPPATRATTASCCGRGLRPPLNGGGMPPERRRGRLGGREDALPRYRRARHRLAVAGAGPFRARRRHGPASPTAATGIASAPAAREPVGRTRTAPAADARPSHCASPSPPASTTSRASSPPIATWRRDLDLVVHLGDYIYEKSWGPSMVRKHEVGEPDDPGRVPRPLRALQGDPDLQAAHAAFPWIVTWDDHEVDNDYANDRSPGRAIPRSSCAARGRLPGLLRAHAAAGVRPAARPRSSTSAPASATCSTSCCSTTGSTARSRPARRRPRRALWPTAPSDARGAHDAGPEQEQWLSAQLARAKTRWNVVAQQTLMAQLARPGRAGRSGRTAGTATRRRAGACSTVADAQAAHPVVIGGDIHSFWVADLKATSASRASPRWPREFVGTSITSQGPSAESIAVRSWPSRTSAMAAATSAAM